MTDVVRRRKTAPPTEVGFYYYRWPITNPIKPEEFRGWSPITVVEVSSQDNEVGLWDPYMECIDPLPVDCEWFGPVPTCEEEPS